MSFEQEVMSNFTCMQRFSFTRLAVSYVQSVDLYEYYDRVGQKYANKNSSV